MLDELQRLQFEGLQHRKNYEQRQKITQQQQDELEQQTKLLEAEHNLQQQNMKSIIL